MAVIEFESVSKRFMHSGGAKLLRAHVEERFRRQRQHEVFYALKDVSLEVGRSESLGVIGGNGAGKSTLLSLVAGLCAPSEGSITVRGRVAALLELGSGFHPDLTGAENLRLNASLLGLSRRRTDEAFESIVDFSEIRNFIQDPIRTYSSGMILRLGFSVAIHVDPDILIIDEVLAVGDQRFQAKCFDRILQFKQAGKTLLFVSHGPELIRKLCDRAIWLDHGKVRMAGPPDQVLEAYAGPTG
jgi:ABC-type polysaccharide/polyol phosphate transport system ATPase subunit